MKQLEFSSLSEKNLGKNYTIFETALNQLMPTLPSYRNLRIDLQCHANKLTGFYILGTLAINDSPEYSCAYLQDEGRNKRSKKWGARWIFQIL